MGKKFRLCAVALCAAAFIAVTSIARAEPARNCPALTDQFIIVSKTEPTEFRLNVFNLGDSTISIFQFPLGGVLQQDGDSPLDFVFVPMPDFGGTTTFAYRLSPPAGCSIDYPVAHVTLAGGTSDGTDAGLNPPVFDLCGVSIPLAFPLMVLGFVVAQRRRRK